MTECSFIHLRSSKFPILPDEHKELVNEGMYGKACALYVQAGLAADGYSTPFIACEDWAWWVEVAGLGIICGVGVYGMQIEDSTELDLCVTTLATKSKTWSWRQFRSIDHSAEIHRLHETLKRVLTTDADILILGESLDFPLG